MPQKNLSSAVIEATKETVVEYFQKTSLNGFGLLYYIRRRKYQRTFWFMFILLGIAFAAYVVLCTLISYLEEPTVTSLISQHQPIWNIPFTALAVCSVNKLSRQAVERYANQLVKGNATDMDWLEKMKLFAGFYDIEAFDDIWEINKLELQLFNSLSIEENEMNVSDLLKQLAPKCQELLLKCAWAGEFQNCQDLFQLEATATGHCCMFNWQFDAAVNNSTLPLMHPNGTGIEKGVTLLLNASTSDYFYAEGNTNGFIIQLFDPEDFPDISTGSAQEIIVQPDEYLELELSLVTQSTESDARDFSVLQRRCYFADEEVAKQLSMGTYSQGNCLARCKMHNIFAMCGCLPYYAPISETGAAHWNESTHVVHCSLIHFKCLRESAASSLDTFDAPKCASKCLPLCSYNQYYYRKRTSAMQLTNITTFISNAKQNNLSLVSIYFSTPHATQYNKNVVYNWYQILSNIGGVIGICMGCSFISGFEIIYFLGFRFFELLHTIHSRSI